MFFFIENQGQLPPLPPPLNMPLIIYLALGMFVHRSRFVYFSAVAEDRENIRGPRPLARLTINDSTFIISDRQRRYLSPPKKYFLCGYVCNAVQYYVKKIIFPVKAALQNCAVIYQM